MFFFLGQPLVQLIQTIGGETITAVTFDQEGETDEKNKKEQEKVELEEGKILPSFKHHTIALYTIKNTKRLGLPIQFFGDIALEITIPPPDYSI
jgi:hypothetical protein